MKISVITAAFNSEATIADTIDSIRQQTHDDIEHIIVDGASTDGTVDIARASKDVVSHFVSEPDDGIYDAMNKGIGLATGDVFATLNADDVYADNTVLAQVADVFADPEIDACFADLVYVDQHDLNKVVRYWRSSDYQPGAFARGWVPGHPTFFARRRMFEKFGGFDPSFGLAADFELMARLLARHRLNSRYVPSLFVRMRLGGASNRSIRSIAKQNLDVLRAMRANGIPISPLFFIRRVWARVSQFAMRPEGDSA